MINDTICKTLLHGAGCSTAASLLLGGPTNNIFVRLLNQEVSMQIWLFYGVLGCLASVAADIGHSILKPDVPVQDKSMDISSLVLSSGLSVAAIAALSYCIEPQLIQQIGWTNLGMIGVAGEIAGTYGCDLMRNII